MGKHSDMSPVFPPSPVVVVCDNLIFSGGGMGLFNCLVAVHTSKKFDTLDRHSGMGKGGVAAIHQILPNLLLRPGQSGIGRPGFPSPPTQSGQISPRA